MRLRYPCKRVSSLSFFNSTWRGKREGEKGIIFIIIVGLKAQPTTFLLNNRQILLQFYIFHIHSRKIFRNFTIPKISQNNRQLTFGFNTNMPIPE